MMRPFPDDLTPHDFLDAASLPGRRGPSDGGRVLRFSPDAMAALERRAEEARDTLAKLDAEDAAAGYAPVSVGDVVAYDCPTWGPSRGRVLAVFGREVLVQDLAPDGAREYWPRGEIRRATA